MVILRLSFSIETKLKNIFGIACRRQELLSSSECTLTTVPVQPGIPTIKKIIIFLEKFDMYFKRGRLERLKMSATKHTEEKHGPFPLRILAIFQILGKTRSSLKYLKRRKKCSTKMMNVGNSKPAGVHLTARRRHCVPAVAIQEREGFLYQANQCFYFGFPIQEQFESTTLQSYERTINYTFAKKKNCSLL